ncbi:MAG TPA: glycosyltransferase, partial [Syntrophales bacterium]|nr:glycosyltransferase [Syntrophales bacterium]
MERFHPSGDRRDIRRRLGIPENRAVILTVRNLVPRMGLENLITAMKDVVKALPDVLLIIGGSGPLREKLLRLACELQLSDSIRFTGFIRDEELPDYYRAADIFVLPTIELEGFGLVTLEALACG